ncbi:transcription factor bHLH94-like isoform X2 [Rhodamnia argentea]|uniref:Transcription factor bHLH94-like isoform X2 n=1 Tax=Rhodamnia argentea TaxID=178133 RepID=A0A8B8NYG5_9MYRT|nr:transcription factor bHLH94-like isoform X2 [Rhodamnia argentea]
MALETVVFQQDPFSCYGGAWTHHVGSGCFGDDEKTRVHESAALSLNAAEAEAAMNVDLDGWDAEGGLAGVSASPPPMAAIAGRRKRRRTRMVKNSDDVESQRRTHIAVERNRRKQMNEYLAVLRSMMPPSYVQRGDQASIIAGAINFVKELEQHLQSLKSQKQPEQVNEPRSASPPNDHFSSLFSDYFNFPQYSTRPDGSRGPDTRPAAADVEVTLVDSHANIKVLSRNQPRQLHKMVVGLHSLRLGVLHLTLTTVHNMVLYSFSVKELIY